MAADLKISDWRTSSPGHHTWLHQALWKAWPQPEWSMLKLFTACLRLQLLQKPINYQSERRIDVNTGSVIKPTRKDIEVVVTD